MDDLFSKPLTAADLQYEIDVACRIMARGNTDFNCLPINVIIFDKAVDPKDDE